MFHTYDEGIFNAYTMVTQIPVRNRSEDDVESLQGEVEVLRANGSLIAKLPVAFKGGLLAGEQRLLDVQTPTIEGDGRLFRLKVTGVRLHSL
jgi:hypothetical protein